MALRATVTTVGAMVAAVSIDSAALPRIKTESQGLSAQAPAQFQWLGAFHGRLVYVPLPALLLGVGAIALRAVRRPLAVAAMLAGVASLLIIVGTLVTALMPLYQNPRDLGLPE